jgi:hypothetical protein
LNLKFAFDANRTVVNDGNFGSHKQRSDQILIVAARTQ